MAVERAKRIFVVRHGNTFDKGEVVTRVGGRTDLALSQSGRAQAEVLAEHFDGRGVRFDAAYCSHLRRTRQTGEAILRRQRNGVELNEAEFLREIDYGPDENKPEADVIARVGEAALAAWDRDGVAPDGWIVNVVTIINAWAAFIDAVQRGAADNVLVVTSNGVARFLLRVPGLRIDVSDPDIKLKTGAYGVIRVEQPGACAVEQWNCRP